MEDIIKMRRKLTRAKECEMLANAYRRQVFREKNKKWLSYASKAEETSRKYLSEIEEILGKRKEAQMKWLNT